MRAARLPDVEVVRVGARARLEQLPGLVQRARLLLQQRPRLPQPRQA